MPPRTIALPPRANAFQYTEEDVRTVIALFGENPAGTAIALQDEPEDSENKARRRCQIMREQIAKIVPTPDGYTVRGHVVPIGDPTGEKKEGERTVILYAAYMPALSLNKKTDTDVADPTTDAAAPDAAADAQPAADAEPAATGATEATENATGGRRGKRS